jgi:hypothetical protein
VYVITEQVVSLFLLVEITLDIKDNNHQTNNNIFIHRYRTAVPSPKVEEDTAMRDRNDSLTRRNALKKGGLTVTALGVGIPVIGGNAAAQFPTMAVDAPPVISTDQRGTVVAAVYPGGDVDPVEVIAHGGFDGFKLGPDRGITEVDEVIPHADSVRHRLLPTGNLGVFFDSSTAETWFESIDDKAKISAVGTDDGGEPFIVAWGSDEVSVRATPSPN